jgi:hypothetical protein
MSWSRVAIIASICLGLTAAAAQQRETASTACSTTNRGTVNCPTYTAPATTAVPQAPMDGSMNVPAQTATTLFNGAVPPNGFMVQAGPNANGPCLVNDNGPASGAGYVTSGAGYAGILFPGTAPLYVTPPGYRPMGPVSVWCFNPSYIAARGW